MTSSLIGAALALSIASSPVAPRPGGQLDGAEMAAAIRRLAVAGRVLYVAAHPDDENTRLLAWLVGAKGLTAAYLSLTRGGGGQNLIGTEQGPALGLVRTHELLAARRVDGAEQLFTRARDFGYSKSAEETLRVWGRDEVLSDVVRAVRRFRPDVIVTRFTTRPPNHGHHTASAILAAEAFRAAADPKRYPDQLRELPVWQADRLLYNVSTWRLGPDDDLSEHLKIDVGTYDPLAGRSYGEIAALSRSQHKSQGFGVAAQRGPVFEYFAPLDGSVPRGDPLEGLDLTWRRFSDTEELRRALHELEADFDPAVPSMSVHDLQRVEAALERLPDTNPYKVEKLAEVRRLIAAAAGLSLEVRAEGPTVVPGEKAALHVTALNRSPVAMNLVKVRLPAGGVIRWGRPLAHHQPFERKRTITLPGSAPITTPYWLQRPPTKGRYEVADPSLIGLPEGEPPLSALFEVAIHGRRYSFRRPVVYAWVDPVRGELYRDVEIAPAVTAAFDRDVVMVPGGEARRVEVVLSAGRPGVAGRLRLDVPEGWRVSPQSASFRLVEEGQQQALAFDVSSPKGARRRGRLRAVIVVDGEASSWRAQRVDHPHIPPRTVRTPAEAELVPLSLQTGGRRIGYLPGSGDLVAESLAAVGYDVTTLTRGRLQTEDLSRFDAILVGVRAFNAHPWLDGHRARLLAYVEGGGRLVVQYNTNSRVGPLRASAWPYPLEIGRGRVTDETAAMTPVDADHPLLQRPNALTAADYEGWVQERGLYFASSWDRRYQPLFRMHDEGEPPLEGALLVAQYGEGMFVYTGLSFFRQLPAGVPGAYRLLANLLAR